MNAWMACWCVILVYKLSIFSVDSIMFLVKFNSTRVLMTSVELRTNDFTRFIRGCNKRLMYAEANCVGLLVH